MVTLTIEDAVLIGFHASTDNANISAFYPVSRNWGQRLLHRPGSPFICLFVFSFLKHISGTDGRFISLSTQAHPLGVLMCLLRVMTCDLHFALHPCTKIVFYTNNIVSGKNLVIYQLMYGMNKCVTDK